MKRIEFNFSNAEKDWIRITTKEKHKFPAIHVENCPDRSSFEKLTKHPSFRQFYTESQYCFIVILDQLHLSEEWHNFKLEFNPHKPMIIQLQSITSKRIIYKDSRRCKFHSITLDRRIQSEIELIEVISKKRCFNLSLLLNILHCGFGGKFNGDINELNIKADELFDDWRLIDYLARDDDDLSIRLMMLFGDWRRSSENFKQTLDVAGEFSGTRSWLALMDLPMTVNPKEIVLNNEQRQWISIRHNSAPFFVASQSGRKQGLSFLLRCNSDFYYEKEFSQVINNAAQKKKYQNVRLLIDEDCPFPQCQNTYSASKLLRRIKSERDEFHKSIGNAEYDKVKKYLNARPNLKYAYNSANDTAILSALNKKRYEMLSYLMSVGMEKDEKTKAELENRMCEADLRSKLKALNSQFLRKETNTYISHLLLKSRFWGDKMKTEFYDKARKLYLALDSIEEIQIVLKVVEHAETLLVIFDFKSESVNNVDPTQSHKTRGSCEYEIGHIYIGGNRPDNEVLGTLAHELTHLAMQIRYGNSCNPYEHGDHYRIKQLDAIVNHHCNNKQLHPIISDVFNYHQNDWHSEIIVRIPHILAQLKNKYEVIGILKKVSDLRDWYASNVTPDLYDYIKMPQKYKDFRQVQIINASLNVLQKYCDVHDDAVRIVSTRLFTPILKSKKITIISSNQHKLTLLNVMQSIKEFISINDLLKSVILVDSDKLCRETLLKQVLKVVKSSTLQELIIECIEPNDTKLLSDFMIEIMNCGTKIIIITNFDCSEHFKKDVSLRQFKPIDDENYSFYDLESNSQNALLKLDVRFQGELVSLDKLMDLTSPILNDIDIHQLLFSENPVRIGKPLFVPHNFENDLYIDRNLCQSSEFPEKSRTFQHSESLGNFDLKIRDMDDIIQNDDCVVITESPGAGKSTFLSYISKKIKRDFPYRWVIRIDLNRYSFQFEKQSKLEYDQYDAMRFFIDDILNLESRIDKLLFEHSMDNDCPLKIVLLIDGFDEICPRYERLILIILLTLRRSFIKQIWITSRHHLREFLQETLQVLSHFLKPLEFEDHVRYLINIWTDNVLANSRVENFERIRKVLSYYSSNDLLKLEDLETDTKIIQTSDWDEPFHKFAFSEPENSNEMQKISPASDLLVIRFAAKIVTYVQVISSIPLHTNLVGEFLKRDVQSFITGVSAKLPEIQDLDFFSMYENIIKEKYHIFWTEKSLQRSVESQKFQNDLLIKKFRKIHQLIAMHEIFDEQALKSLNVNFSHPDSTQYIELQRVGLIEIYENTLYFTHRTFAEYFAADYITERLIEGSFDIRYFFNKYILHNIGMGTVLSFIEHFLVRYEMPLFSNNWDFRFYSEQNNSKNRVSSKIISRMIEKWNLMNDCEYFIFIMNESLDLMLKGEYNQEELLYLTQISEMIQKRSMKLEVINSIALGTKRNSHNCIFHWFFEDDIKLEFLYEILRNKSIWTTVLINQREYFINFLTILLIMLPFSGQTIRLFSRIHKTASRGNSSPFIRLNLRQAESFVKSRKDGSPIEKLCLAIDNPKLINVRMLSVND